MKILRFEASRCFEGSLKSVLTLPLLTFISKKSSEVKRAFSRYVSGKILALKACWPRGTAQTRVRLVFEAPFAEGEVELLVAGALVLDAVEVPD